MQRILNTFSGASEEEAIIPLHRYFIAAIRMRRHFNDCVLASPSASQEYGEALVESLLYMGFWYAGLYVVIEGWHELGLSDPAINALLESPNIDLLKRYRHGVCHFQREYFDKRFTDFVGAQVL